MAEPIDPALLLDDLPFARRLARSLVGDHAAADDLVQEGWLTIARRPPRHADNLRGYWSAVLRRLASHGRRSEARRARRERDLARDDPAPSADELVERMELHQLAVEALLAMDEPYRRTLLRHYLDELPLRAIAADEGLPLETVRTRVRRGLARLRERLDEERGRRAWLAVLAPLAQDARRPASAVAPLAAAAAALALVVALVAALAAVRGNPPSGEPPGARTAAADDAAGAAAGARSARAARRVDAATGEAASDAPTIRGVVRDAEGRGIDGVEVGARWVWWDEQREIGRGVTDVVGRFAIAVPVEHELGALQRGATTLGLRCAKPGYRPASTLAAPDGVHEVELVRGRLASGRVLDARGAPVATVYALVETHGGRRAHAATDARGTYHVGLEPGERIARVRYAGAAGAGHVALDDAGHASGDVRVPDLVLRPCESIAGRVTRPDGAPAALAAVEARLVGFDAATGAWTWAAAEPAAPEVDPGRRFGHTTAGADGRFEIGGLQRGRYLVTTRWDLRRAPCPPDAPLAPQDLFDAGAHDVVLVDSDHVLDLTLADEAGEPLRGARVVCATLDAAGARVVDTLEAHTVGPDARITFPVRPGALVVLLADVAGALPHEQRVAIEPAGWATRFAWTLRAVRETGRLALDVRGTDGAPSAGWSASLLAPTLLRPIAGLTQLEPSPDGVLDAIPPGEYRVLVTPPDGARHFDRRTLALDPVRVAAGRATRATVALGRGGRLAVRFVEPIARTDAPLPHDDRSDVCPVALPTGSGLGLSITPAAPSTEAAALRVDGVVPAADGSAYELPWSLAPGAWRLRVTSPAHEPVEVEATLEAGVRSELVLVLAPL